MKQLKVVCARSCCCSHSSSPAVTTLTHNHVPKSQSMSKLLLLALIFFASHGLAIGQSRFLATNDEAKNVGQGIVASLAAGNYAGAMKELKPLSVIPVAEFDAFEAQFNSQLENLLRRFGAPTGYELFREEKSGSRMIRYQYLVFHEKAPIRWMLVFYKGEKGWYMTDFKFDTNGSSFFPGG